MSTRTNTWHVGTEQGVFEPVCVTSRTPLRLGSCSGVAGFSSLGDGLEVSSIDARIPTPILLDAGDPRPCIGCIFVLTGEAGMALEGIEPLQLARGSATFCLTESGRGRFQMLPSENMRMVSCRFPLDWFERLDVLLGDQLRDVQRAAKGQGYDPFAISFNNPQRLLRLGHELLTNPYSGAAAHLYLEAKLLEITAFLSNELAGTKSGPKTGPMRRGERDRLMEARDRLLADLANPPTLESLVGATGLNRKKLLQGFRELFGATPAELVRDARLDMACTWLEEGLLTHQEIALRLGYSAPANFTHAFRMRFGMPPSRWPRG